MKFSTSVKNISMEGTVSQIFNLGFSLDLITKTGNFLTFFQNTYSTFHKVKSRTEIKNLRHGFLHHSMKNKYTNFENCKLYIKQDIFVKKN